VPAFRVEGEVVPVPGFPKLVVEPGSYPCVVEHPNGQRLAAVLDLDAGQSPRGQVFDWPVPERGGIRTVPQPVEQFPLLKCMIVSSRISEVSTSAQPATGSGALREAALTRT
jgi:hypothetical protein